MTRTASGYSRLERSGDPIFSAQAVKVIDRLQTRYSAASEADGQPRGILPLVTLIPLIMEVAAKFAALLAMCKKPVPPTPPVPDALAAVGVTQDTWHKAFVSKYGATEADDGEGGFKPWAVKRTKIEIARSRKIKKKEALPLAIAALESGRDETAEDLAIAFQSARSNAASFGA